MILKNNYSNNLTLFQKLRNYDYVLVMCILIVGIVSIFTMYSTDGGQVLYHTKSHFLKFSIFFCQKRARNGRTRPTTVWKKQQEGRGPNRTSHRIDKGWVIHTFWKMVKSFPRATLFLFFKIAQPIPLFFNQ